MSFLIGQSDLAKLANKLWRLGVELTHKWSVPILQVLPQVIGQI